MTTAKIEPSLATAKPAATAGARLRRGEIPYRSVAPGESDKRSMLDRLEAFISRLSTRNNFWHKVCSLIWLPYAFRSGITMKRLDPRRFTAVLPFRRFNRNWYNAMAGAALLGNSEVAAGMYLFSQCGEDYIVVCKELRYEFLRPCYGPAVYTIINSEDLAEKVKAGSEFNILLEMEITQQLTDPRKRARKKKAAQETADSVSSAPSRSRPRPRRIGRCHITFHCTPKAMLKDRAERRTTKGD